MSQDQAEKNEPCVCACEAERKLTKAERLIIEAQAKVDEANAINEHEATIQFVKGLRVGFDENLQKLKQLPESVELQIAATRIKEGIMWLGMELKRLGEANPYPNSYNAENATVDPTADGLKL
jgi:hypothetical protein